MTESKGIGRPSALLCSCDRSLVVDGPDQDDPALVVVGPGVEPALMRGRHAGIPNTIVARRRPVPVGHTTPARLASTEAAVNERFGPVDVIISRSRDASGGCPCREPRPGSALQAMRPLAMPPNRCLAA